VVDGRQLPILTELWKAVGGTLARGGRGDGWRAYGIGALIGAGGRLGERRSHRSRVLAPAAAMPAALLTRGRPTILEPETQLSFRW